MKEKSAGIDNADGRAMEGRATLKDGTDAGDVNFHEQGWNFDQVSEHAQLAYIEKNVVAFEEQQVRSLAKSGREFGAKAYRQLLNRYPENERAEEWRIAAEELEKG